jgi:hypothetical protein
MMARANSVILLMMPVLETLMEMAISTYMHVTFLTLMMV